MMMDRCPFHQMQGAPFVPYPARLDVDAATCSSLYCTVISSTSWHRVPVDGNLHTAEQCGPHQGCAEGSAGQNSAGAP